MAQRRNLALLVPVILLLAGCAAGPSASPSPSDPVESDSASPTPTPEPTRPTASELTVSPAGLGDLAVGSPVDAGDAATSIVAWSPGACESPDIPGLWESSIDASANVYWSDREPFAIATEDFAEDGAIRLLQVFSEQIRTEAGVGVGSSGAEVAAAYPQVEPRDDLNQDVDAYVIEEGGNRMTLEVIREGAVTWEPADYDKLLMITVESAAMPASSYLNTDVGAHCPA